MRKHVILLSYWLICFSACHARYVSHKMVETTIEVRDGKEFSFTKISDMGHIHDDYAINRVPVEKQEFDAAWDIAGIAEMRKQRQEIIERQNARMKLIDDAQTLILQKSIKQSVLEAQKIIQHLSNPALEAFLKFDIKTVPSKTQLDEMKLILDRVEIELETCIAKHDLQGLKLILQKVENWPHLLEQLFNNSVQFAISKSDDTSKLKDLLLLIST